MNRLTSPRHRVVLALSAPLLVLSLAACGSNEPAATDDPQTQSQPGGEDGGRPGDPGVRPGGAGFPGASGEVVAVDGTTAQVRNERTGQVAVSWTAATTFTTTATRSLADIKGGDCVVVAGADEDGTPAESVSVTAADDGSCADAAFGGAGRGPGMPGGSGGSNFTPPQGFPSDRPEGAPTDLPEDGRPGGRGAIVVGEVTAVDATTLTVEALSFTGGTPSEEGAEPATESRTVTVDAETTVTAVVDAKADAVEVGACVTARGETDDVGAVTAESIAVLRPVDGACGFGGFGGFGGGARPESGAST